MKYRLIATTLKRNLAIEKEIEADIVRAIAELCPVGSTVRYTKGYLRDGSRVTRIGTVIGLDSSNLFVKSVESGKSYWISATDLEGVWDYVYDKKPNA